MPEKIINYKCPACTGPLHYVGDSGKLECDYCGSKYTIAEIESIYKEKVESAAEAAAAESQEEAPAEEEAGGASSQTSPGGWDTSSLENWNSAGQGLRVYSCPSCGAELICDENTAATRCPYCGNPTVVPGQLSGTLKPDYVLPFKLKKEDAQKALLRHYQGKALLPDTFRDEKNIQEVSDHEETDRLDFRPSAGSSLRCRLRGYGGHRIRHRNRSGSRGHGRDLPGRERQESGCPAGAGTRQ